MWQGKPLFVIDEEMARDSGENTYEKLLNVFCIYRGYESLELESLINPIWKSFQTLLSETWNIGTVTYFLTFDGAVFRNRFSGTLSFLDQHMRGKTSEGLHN